MAGGEQTHTIKYVEFLGETRPIILQNLAGPLAENISQKKLLDMVAHKLNSVTNNPQHNSAHVISRLATGIDVNIKFKGITEFELTTERVLFDLLNIPLYHGWIVDPQDSKTYNALGSKSYNTILGDLVGLETGFVGIEDEKRPEEDSVTTVNSQTRKASKMPIVYTNNCHREDFKSGARGTNNCHREDFKSGARGTNNCHRGDFKSGARGTNNCHREDVMSRARGTNNCHREDVMSGARDMDSIVLGTCNAFIAGKLIKNFLATTTSQLTVHGLVCLRKELKELELCVLFRNNHLSTMFKFGGQLYLLVTEEGYKDHPNVVWEMLNEVNGNTPFMTGNFKEFRAECDYVSNTCVEENFWTAEYLASTNDAAHDNSSFNRVSIHQYLINTQIRGQCAAYARSARRSYNKGCGGL
ncbi:hypothetical protein DCAR_0623153 [Daucus carota subsp. sativus]|uniref:MINDY deubiquitinase domain-containing protein n=1 Tax=Daucus carota subsp. sativus TaxID=79200 RepID=A0AAF0X961_DAUCS|nr:hypothetical protein DCAR_0623153 [Daucus carota subsp. sativus]